MRSRASERGECTACDDTRARTKERVFTNVDTAKTKLVDALAAHQPDWATATDREYALNAVWTPKWSSAPKVCGPCLADATRRACKLVDGRKLPPRPMQPRSLSRKRSRESKRTAPAPAAVGTADQHSPYRELSELPLTGTWSEAAVFRLVMRHASIESEDRKYCHAAQLGLTCKDAQLGWEERCADENLQLVRENKKLRESIRSLQKAYLYSWEKQRQHAQSSVNAVAKVKEMRAAETASAEQLSNANGSVEECERLRAQAKTMAVEVVDLLEKLDELDTARAQAGETRKTLRGIALDRSGCGTPSSTSSSCRTSRTSSARLTVCGRPTLTPASSMTCRTVRRAAGCRCAAATR